MAEIQDTDILSNDEVDTLLNEEGAAAQELLSPQDINPYDFAHHGEKTINDLSKIENIHELFRHDAAHRLSHFYCRKIELEINKPAIVPFSEYLQSLSQPLLINIIDVKNLSGPGIIDFSKNFMENSIEILFGGNVNNPSLKDRNFARAELRIAKLLTELINKSLSVAWNEVAPLELEYVRSLTNIRMANIVDNHENVLLSRCTFTFEQNQCEFNICLPCSTLEAVKSLIEVQNQDGLTEDEQRTWRKLLRHNIENMRLDVVCNISENKIRLDDLMKLSVGDVLYINNPKMAKMYIGDIQLFNASCGTNNENRALKITEICSE